MAKLIRGEIITYILEHYLNLFLEGIAYTLLMSAITVLFGCLLGGLLTFMKQNKWGFSVGKVRIAPLSLLATIYIEIIRGTPILLQLYFFYFLLPGLFPMLNLSKFTSIMVALICNSAAYVSEIFRAGIASVDRGQTEAARSLGLNQIQTMQKIVLPQAIKSILPAMANEFIMMIKETSLASTFFVGDLMTQFQTISGALYVTLEPLIIVGVIYFVLTFTLSKGVAVLERRLNTNG